MAAQPKPTRTPRRMMVSRWTPVSRSVERMLTPSVRAEMISTCRSNERMFIGGQSRCCRIGPLAGKALWRYIPAGGHGRGQSCCDLGPVRLQPRRSRSMMLEASGSDRDFRRCNAGRLAELDEPPSEPIRGRYLSLSRERGSGPSSCFLAPDAGRRNAGARCSPIHDLRLRSKVRHSGAKRTRCQR